MNATTHLKKAMVLGCVVLVSGAVRAADGPTPMMRYTYLEGGYVSTDIDNGVDGDGVAIGGSVALNKTFFLLGDYATQDLDFGIDLDQFRVGLGGRMPLATDLDLVGTVSYVRSEVDVGAGDSHENALGLGAGLRGRLTNAFELEGGISYDDIDRFSDKLSLVVAGRYYFTPAVALGAGVEAGDDVTIWRIGCRYSFQ